MRVPGILWTQHRSVFLLPTEDVGCLIFLLPRYHRQGARGETGNEAGEKNQLQELVLGSIVNRTLQELFAAKAKCHIIKQHWPLFHMAVCPPLQSIILLTTGTLPYKGKQLPSLWSSWKQNMVSSLREKMWQGKCWGCHWGNMMYAN